MTEPDSLEKIVRDMRRFPTQHDFPFADDQMLMAGITLAKWKDWLSRIEALVPSKAEKWIRCL